MEAKAVAKYIRISPRKVRIVMNLIRGKNVADAFAILKFTPKAGADVINKVLKSAVANAENNFDMNPDNLYVATAFVDQVPIAGYAISLNTPKRYVMNGRLSES